MILDNYTEQQILALSDEEVEKIIKLHLAENGIKLLQKPTEPKYFEVAKQDQKVFKVTGFDYYFVEEEDAKEMQRLIKQKFSKLKRKNGWDEEARLYPITDYYVKDINSIKIEEEIFYSEELYQQVAKKITDNNLLKKDYEAVKREYDDNYSSSSDIRNEVFSRINEVKSKYNNFDNMKLRFKEYMELANQQEDIAWSFLEKAYTITQECKDYIKANN